MTRADEMGILVHRESGPKAMMTQKAKTTKTKDAVGVWAVVSATRLLG